jgi:hypothetical protein
VIGLGFGVIEMSISFNTVSSLGALLDIFGCVITNRLKIRDKAFYVSCHNWINRYSQ